MLAKTYLTEIHKALRYYATWAPQNNFELGDIGIMKGKQFIYLDKLKNKKVSFVPNNGLPKKDDAFSYYSEDNIKISTKLVGEADKQILDAKAKMIIKFGRKNSILFRPKGVTMHKIEDQLRLAEQITKLYKEKKWKRDWVVITELIEVDSATILISNSKNATAEISASSNVEAGMFNIADAKLGLKLSHSKSLGIEILAAQALTPLYSISGMGRFSSRFTPRSKDTVAKEDPSIPESFGEIPFDDLAW